jgi:hypothetical protein
MAGRRDPENMSPKENFAVVEHKWRLVPKTPDKRYESRLAESLETNLAVDLPCAFLVNILKPCHLSCMKTGFRSRMKRRKTEEDPSVNIKTAKRSSGDS